MKLMILFHEILISLNKICLDDVVLVIQYQKENSFVFLIENLIHQVHYNELNFGLEYHLHLGHPR
jgi:hypothetical protein